MGYLGRWASTSPSINIRGPGLDEAGPPAQGTSPESTQPFSMRVQIRRLMAFAVSLSLGVGFTVEITDNSNTMANALISGPGINLLDS